MNLQATSLTLMLRIKPSLDATKLSLSTDDGAVSLSLPLSAVPFADQLGGLVVTHIGFMVVSEGGAATAPPGLILSGKSN